MTRFQGLLAAILAVSPSLALAADPALLDKEAPDQWRASKLSGVRIYGPDDKSVGKITDVLMGKDGKAQYVVVGVGGFLGIGQKDIAIPFDQVVFSAEPIKAAPSTMGGSARPAAPGDVPGVAPPAQGTAADSPAGATPAVGGVSTSTALGMPAEDPGTGMAPSTAYPDHGRISMTVDQLKGAPSFQFAQ